MAGLTPLPGSSQWNMDSRGNREGTGTRSWKRSGRTRFSEIGENVRGHEFHYTFLLSPKAENLEFAFRVHRGYGFDGQHDGLCLGNVMGSYTHIHALGAVDWAPSLVRAAEGFKTQ